MESLYKEVFNRNFILASLLAVAAVWSDVGLWLLARLQPSYPRILFYPDLVSWTVTAVAGFLLVRRGVWKRTVPAVLLVLMFASRLFLSWENILEYPRRPLIGYTASFVEVAVPLHLASIVLACICLLHPGERLGPVLRAPSLSERWLLLLSFVYAVVLRVVPEILYWPYIVGFDTVEYAAAVRDLKFYGWHPFAKTWWYGGWGNRPPLLYLLLFIPALFRADTTLLVKVAAPLVYGLLGFSAAVWGLKIGLRGWWLLACSVFVSTYFVVLGFSWQLLSNVLGVALALIAIAFLEELGTLRRALIAIVVSLVACLAHPVASVMMAAVCGLAIVTFRVRGLREAAVVSAVLVISLLLTSWYLDWRPFAPAHEAGGAPVPAPSSLVVGTEGLVVDFLRKVAGYYYLLLPFAFYSLVRLEGFTLLKLLFLAFMVAWVLALFAGLLYGSLLRLAVVPAPLIALFAFVGLLRIGKRLAALYLCIVLITGLHYACSRSVSVIIANAFPGAFEKTTYFPSGMVSSVLPPELQEEVFEVGRLLYQLANWTTPAVIAGANYYVYAHLAGGFNPYVRWVLSTHEIRWRVHEMGLNLSDLKGIYLLSYKGWLPDWARSSAVKVYETKSLELLYLSTPLVEELETLIIVTP